MAIAITEQQRADLIPQFTGEVERAFEETGVLANLFEIKKVAGSDTVIDRVISKAKVERIDWTEEDKHAQVGAVGTLTYKLEHSIYIRHAEKNISKLISDLDVLKELTIEHGVDLAVQRDATILTAILQASRMDAMSASGVSGIDASVDLDKVVTEGLHVVFENANDEKDVSLVEDALESIIIAMRSTRKWTPDMHLVMSWGLYNTLRDSDKLGDEDFSAGNSDYAEGVLRKFMGVPVMPIATFQDLQGYVGVTNPIGDTWNTTATDAAARAVFFSPRAIRVLEAMPVTFNMHYSEDHLTNYITSQAFYGVGVRRQDHVGALYTSAAYSAGVFESNVTAASFV